MPLALVYCVSMAFRAYGSPGTWYQRAFWAAGWSFAPGILLAVIEVAWAQRWRGAAWGRHAALGLMALWVLVAVAYPSTDVDGLGRRAVLATAATFLLVGAPLMLQWTTGRCWRAFDNLPLRWLGERSYSFYLIHFVIGVEVTRHIARGAGHARQDLLASVPLALVLTLIAAHLIYRFVESPFLTRKRRQSPTAGGDGPAGVAGDNVVAPA